MHYYKYKIYNPNGNVTALVIGLVHEAEVRRKVQDAILARHRNVEQVGFVSESADEPRLFMAGGEFCGNATCAAAWHYLGGLPGDLSIRVSGAAGLLKAGVSSSLKVWAHMPVPEKLENVQKIGEGMNFVDMEGIAHLVVEQRQSRRYLKGFDVANKEDRARLKVYAKELMVSFGLFNRDACGVMFCENVSSMTRIHPCVFINSAGTAFYEMACGSGSIAVGLTEAALLGESVCIPILQPSDMIIDASVEICGGIVSKAKISGVVSDLSDGISMKFTD